MNNEDRRLGMDAEITRRDFVGGVGVAVGAALLPACAAEKDAAPLQAAYYPPGLTGMRGSHAGSFEVAHSVVQGQQWIGESSGEHYDLVVVGAGISGLAAAYFYRRDVKADARILILDNHDDFGGHAKRNEFEINGRTIVGFGGTMLMEAPASYPDNAAKLMRELGIDVEKEAASQHFELYESRGLVPASFFDAETFGADHLAPLSYDTGPDTSGAPLSDAAKADMKRLHDDDRDYLAGMSNEERTALLQSISWREYLKTYASIGDEVLDYFQKRSHGVWAIGADALPAWMALLEGYPGFGSMRIDGSETEPESDNLDYFHFPDGNASIARMLVREMIPAAASGSTMQDIVTARFDYSMLDRADNPTRLRLNSTVTGLAHRNGKLDGPVDVTYVNAGKALTVSAERVVWAGYHAIVPHICADVSADQLRALAEMARAPLVYTNVLIRNWRSFVELGCWRVFCPGSFFQSVRLDFPVSIGDYRFSAGPDEPIVLHLQHIPTQPGLPAAEQFVAGRRQLLETSFETFERNVRSQLERILGAGGFDPATDIAAITVNRWPHGYAYSVDSASGEVAWWPELWQREHKPWVESRRPIGNIHFAGTDSSSNAMTESAIEEAYRAVNSFVSDAS